MYNVLDLSYWQRKNGPVDFDAIKDSGNYGVIIKIGSSFNGWTKDKAFEEFYKGAKKAGLHVGAYFASYDTSIGQAKGSANRVLKELKGKKFDLPIFYDFELFDGVAEAQKAMGNDAYKMCKMFCDILEENKYFVGIYSNTAIFNSLLPFNLVNSQYVTWLADWRENADIEKAHKSCLWQYTNNGRCSGVIGNVDKNYFYRPDIVETIISKGLNGYGENGENYGLFEVSCSVSKGDLERIVNLSREPGKEFNIFVREVK